MWAHFIVPRQVTPAAEEDEWYEAESAGGPLTRAAELGHVMLVGALVRTKAADL